MASVISSERIAAIIEDAPAWALIGLTALREGLRADPALLTLPRHLVLLEVQAAGHIPGVPGRQPDDARRCLLHCAVSSMTIEVSRGVAGVRCVHRNPGGGQLFRKRYRHRVERGFRAVIPKDVDEANPPCQYVSTYGRSNVLGKTVKERQATYVARRKTDGLRRIAVWVPKGHEEEIKTRAHALVAAYIAAEGLPRD
jgi:hypothetical protein